MGKSKPARKALLKARRHNPIRVPDAHLATGSGLVLSAVDEDGNQQDMPLDPKGKGKEQVIPVLNKLASETPTERAWAASTISTLITNDPATRRLFLGKGVLEKLIGLLDDPIGAVRVEGSGTLRNLAIDGGHEVCGAMFNKGLLKTLERLIPMLANLIELIMTEQPLPKTENASKDAQPELDGSQVFALAENVLTLFWCLSETSNKILTSINQMNLAPFLLAFVVHRVKIPGSVVVAAAQCLYAITLDNPPFNATLLAKDDVVSDLLAVVQADEIIVKEEEAGKDKAKTKTGEMEVESDKTAAMQQISQDRKSLLRVLIAGVLHNLSEDGGEQLEGLDTSVVGPILRPMLDVNLANVVEQVEQTLPSIPTAEELAGKEIKTQTDHRSAGELKLDSIEKRLSTLMVALEVMTSVCAGLVDEEHAAPVEEDDAEEEDEDMAEDDEDEDLIAKGRDQDEMEEDMIYLPPIKRTISTSLDGLMATNLHNTLFSLAQPTNMSYPPTTGGPSVHPPTTAVLSAINLRAMEALNNFLLTVSSYAPPPSPQLADSLTDYESEANQKEGEWRVYMDMHFPTLASLWAGSFEIAKRVVGDGETSSPGELLEAKGQEIRKEVLDVLAGVWLGLARSGAHDLSLEFTDDQINGMIQIYNLVPSINLKTRILSAFAPMAMTTWIDTDGQTIITNFLMGIITSQPSPEEVVAALNSIFDIFQEERCIYNSIWRIGGYLAILTGMVAKVKAMSRSVDKRKNPELRAQAEEAYENLAAFVKYRRSVVKTQH